MLKSKIYYATVTKPSFYYRGSITIDEDIIEKADLLIHEKVEVLNMSNGSRIETYVIKVSAEAGDLLKRPAARTGLKAINLLFCHMDYTIKKKSKN
jgi:aspartate 1-decarboxylase